MTEAMKDWPHTLRVNAIAVEALAPALYLSRCAVYGSALPCQRFEDLSPSARQAYIEIASRTLDALRPDPREEHPNAALNAYVTILARGAMRVQS